MSEWKTVQLGDASKYISEKTTINNATIDNYISTENMLPDKQGITKIDKLPQASSVCTYNKCDILVSNIRPYFKKIWYADKNGTNSGDVLVFRLKNNKETENKYLYFCLHDNRFFDYMMAGSKGTKMPRGDKQAILKYNINLPPLPVQRRIAAILSSLDDKIENNRKTCEKLEEIAQAIFKRWFVDGRQDDWKVKDLSDVAIITMGQSPPSSSYNTENDGLPFFQGSKEFGWRKPTVEQWCSQPARIAEKNDILISVRAPVGDINIAAEKCCIGRGLASIRGTIILTSVLYFVISNSIKTIQNMSSGGSVFDSLNKKTLAEVEVCIPSDQILDQYGNVIDTIFNKINLYDEENVKLRNIREALLPKLMSGEIEVDEEEA